MNDMPHPALLPAGLYDLLPPEAEIEAEVTARLMGVLAAHGYERVKPPLVEFEETLLAGAASAAAPARADLRTSRRCMVPLPLLRLRPALVEASLSRPAPVTRRLFAAALDVGVVHNGRDERLHPESTVAR